MHPAHATGFDWDAGNEDHLAEHRIASWEAEEAFLNHPVWVPNTKGRRGRWKMVGRTMGGRALTLVVAVDPVSATLRVITGWDSTTGEKTRYSRRTRG